MATKVCIKCGIEKDISEFRVWYRAKDKRQPTCKECKSIKSPELKEKLRERDELFNLGYRRCWGCGEVKPLAFFNIEKSSHDGYRCVCKKCSYGKDLNNRKNSPQREERYQQYQKKWREKNIDKKHAHDLKFAKVYNQNPDVQAHKRQRERENEQLRLQKSLSHRIREALKRQGVSKNMRTMDLIGCSISFLKTHIESQFQEGMTWKNHTINGWHIDHIKPCDSFDLRDLGQQKRCFHWTNLQPLWSSDNIRKGNKIFI